MRFSTMNLEEIVSTIHAMRRQEENGYSASDYLEADTVAGQGRSTSRPKGSGSNDSHLDQNCRFRMAQWCYQVVDYCKFSRHTVAIAMNYLDRYMSTPQSHEAHKSRSAFQLAAMTCLYTSVKIHEPEAMEPRVISGLSRNAYTPAQVEDMERKIIFALKWRMHPPTALSFIYAFIELLPLETSNYRLRMTAIDLAKYQSELAVEDYSFIGLNASTIAFAALANALEGMDCKTKVKFMEKVSRVANIDPNSQVFGIVQEELFCSMNTKCNAPCGTRLQPQSHTVSRTKGTSFLTGNDGSPRGVISR